MSLQLVEALGVSTLATLSRGNEAVLETKECCMRCRLGNCIEVMVEITNLDFFSRVRSRFPAEIVVFEGSQWKTQQIF